MPPGSPTQPNAAQRARAQPAAVFNPIRSDSSRARGAGGQGEGAWGAALLRHGGRQAAEATLRLSVPAPQPPPSRVATSGTIHARPARVLAQRAHITHCELCIRHSMWRCMNTVIPPQSARREFYSCIATLHVQMAMHSSLVHRLSLDRWRQHGHRTAVVVRCMRVRTCADRMSAYGFRAGDCSQL